MSDPEFIEFVNERCHQISCSADLARGFGFEPGAASGGLRSPPGKRTARRAEFRGSRVVGNICRCTGYQNIVKAAQYAARKMRG